METPSDMRRNADQIEAEARQISLLPDREKMLAAARQLRRAADVLEAKQSASKPR